MKKFGIRFTLPENDTLRASHLLGDSFEYFRWYENEAARDAAMEELQRRHEYSRPADAPTVALSKIEE